VQVLVELAAFVVMAEEVGQDSDDRADGLERDVPARADDLDLLGFVGVSWVGGTYTEDHACWEDDAKGQSHEDHVCP
jgi:hypothetical protein